MAALMLLTGNWVFGAAHAAMAAYNIHQVPKSQLARNPFTLFPMSCFVDLLCFAPALMGIGSSISVMMRFGSPSTVFMQRLQGKHHVDVTDIFRQAGPRKLEGLKKAAFHILGFVWTMYTLIGVVVHDLLSPKGRESAGRLLREAAASMHRRRRGDR
jgi:hypothetical protein